MPTYAYCGTTPKSYAEERDEEGVIIGTVSYGDVREFSREWVPPEPAEGEEPLPEPPGWPAPDADWFPSGGPLPVRLPAEESTEGKVPEPPRAPAVPPRVPAAPRTPPPAAPAPPADGAEKEEGTP